MGYLLSCNSSPLRSWWSGDASAQFHGGGEATRSEPPRGITMVLEVDKKQTHN